MNNSSSSWALCSSLVLVRFQHQFGRLYPLMALAICCISVVTNLSNVVILRQRKMRSPTNRILLTIAVSDIAVCLCQIPVIISQNNPNNVRFYAWTLLFLICNTVALLTHTVSLWLGVLLAIFRLLYIRLYPSNSARIHFGIGRAKLAILLTYVSWTLLLIPYPTTMRIKNKTSSNTTFYVPVRDKKNAIVEQYNFWLVAVVGKIVPCMLLLVFGALLLSTLRFAKQRHKRLMSPSAAAPAAPGEHEESLCQRHKASRRSQDHRRTTRILVSIILLSLPTEFPMACLMLTIKLDEDFACIYRRLGDFLDFTSLLKNFLTFVLYCSMSSDYRHEFNKQFLPFLNCNQHNHEGKTIQIGNSDKTKPSGDQNVSYLHNAPRTSTCDFSFFQKHESNTPEMLVNVHDSNEARSGFKNIKTSNLQLPKIYSRNTTDIELSISTTDGFCLSK